VKCLILAAGYATRLYPLTLNTPKPLLALGRGTILDYLLDKVETTPEIDEVIIVSNHKFYSHFTDWAAGRRSPRKITVLDDGSTGNDNRLGAIADIRFAAAEKNINDDTLVLAGDNLFDFALSDFTAFFRRTGWDSVTTHRLDDKTRLRRTGVIEVDENWKVISFEEKPAEPKTNLAVPPFYLYRRDTLPLIADFLEEGFNPDAPGSFIPWLITRRPVGAFLFEGRLRDIGSPESYQAAKKAFAGKYGYE
jgi:glucose-1-phosphate thymidylyltransferase